jgi:hypothetical protein
VVPFAIIIIIIVVVVVVQLTWSLNGRASKQQHITSVESFCKLAGNALSKATRSTTDDCQD